MAFDHAPLGPAEKKTLLRGVVYASRLDAQWAAFLEALRIVHVYEPQTFALSAGVYFTPSFWLPQLKTWLCVRPAGEQRDGDRWKIELFARQHPETRLWVTSGPPRASEWHVEQLGGMTRENGRKVSRGLLLADAGRPGDRVWICGTNDEASEHLIFDSIDIGRPNHAPGFGGSRPADPNSDMVMRIAYAHADGAGSDTDSDSWAPLGASLCRHVDELRNRGAASPHA